MAEIGPVQTPALPLQSLLGIKGQPLPDALNSVVQGTLDLTQMYMIASRELVTFTPLAGPAVGSNLFVNGAVPAGEFWFIHDYVVSSTPGAGAALNMSPAVQQQGILIQKGTNQSCVALENLRIRAPLPFWSQPGDVFGFQVQSVTLAPTVSGFASITRLRA
jgi:hypothetical protein